MAKKKPTKLSALAKLKKLKDLTGSLELGGIKRAARKAADVTKHLAKAAKANPFFVAIDEDLVGALHKLIKEIGGMDALVRARTRDGLTATGKLGLANIHGFSIARKFTNGQPTKQLCICIHVNKKVPSPMPSAIRRRRPFRA